VADYLQVAELKTRFGSQEISTLVSTLGTAEADAKIASAIQDAEGVANGYLSKRFDTLPVKTGSTLKRLVGDLARYFLWDSNPSRTVRQNYEDSMLTLQNIAKGKMDLAGVSDDGEANADAKTNSDTNVLVSAHGTELDLSGF